MQTASQQNAAHRADIEWVKSKGKIFEVAGQRYPMPLTASGQDDVEAGRIRANPVFGDCGLDFFLCGDQLLKGAALNAVQIAERLRK